MGQRRAAARFWTLGLAAFLLVVAPVSRLGSLDLGPSQPGDRADALEGLPFGEGMVLGTSRLSIGEFSREIERSRPLTVAAGLIALGVLLAAIACRTSSLRGRRGRTLLSPLRRIAGPRAPPIQLA
jgi:hypothetical protein